MQSQTCSPRRLLAFWLVSLCVLLPNVQAYFVVNTPTANSVWRLGEANPLKWTKSPDDGIDLLDVELARLTKDGLAFVARDVPARSNSLNILLQDFPVGDDYFAVLMNSTHGVMYATSQRFSIVASSASDQGKEAPDPSAPTVTMSGAPDPTRPWATTMPATSGALQTLISSHALLGSLLSLACTALGGFYVLGW